MVSRYRGSRRHNMVIRELPCPHLPDLPRQISTKEREKQVDKEEDQQTRRRRGRTGFTEYKRGSTVCPRHDRNLLSASVRLPTPALLQRNGQKYWLAFGQSARLAFVKLRPP